MNNHETIEAIHPQITIRTCPAAGSRSRRGGDIAAGRPPLPVTSRRRRSASLIMNARSGNPSIIMSHADRCFDSFAAIVIPWINNGAVVDSARRPPASVALWVIARQRQTRAVGRRRPRSRGRVTSARRCVSGTRRERF